MVQFIPHPNIRIGPGRKEIKLTHWCSPLCMIALNYEDGTEFYGWPVDVHPGCNLRTMSQQQNIPSHWSLLLNMHCLHLLLLNPAYRALQWKWPIGCFLERQPKNNWYLHFGLSNAHPQIVCTYVKGHALHQRLYFDQLTFGTVCIPQYFPRSWNVSYSCTTWFNSIPIAVSHRKFLFILSKCRTSFLSQRTLTPNL